MGRDVSSLVDAERVLYGNKDIYEQRMEVCKQTGISIFYIPCFLWIRSTLHLESNALVGFSIEYNMILRTLRHLIPAIESIATMWVDIGQWNIFLWGLLLTTAIFFPPD
jgi:hypothetical protein